MTKQIKERREYIEGLWKLWKIFGVFNPTLDRKAIERSERFVTATELNEKYPLHFDCQDDSPIYIVVVPNRKGRS